MSKEMVLIVAVIVLPIIILLVAFSDTIQGWFTESAQELHQTHEGMEDHVDALPD